MIHRVNPAKVLVNVHNLFVIIQVSNGNETHLAVTAIGTF
jgi:hypothetical protein